MNYLVLNIIVMINISNEYIDRSYEISYETRNKYYNTFDQYDVNLICTDNGKFETYCPNNEFPLSNKKYFPFEFVVHHNYKITPTHYYDKNNNIKITFKTLYKYDVSEDVYKLYVTVMPIKNNDMYVYSSFLLVMIYFWSIYLCYNKKSACALCMISIAIFVYDYNFKGEYGYFM